MKERPNEVLVGDKGTGCILTPEISEYLGWVRPKIQNYPTWEEIDHADNITICKWQRFLIGPRSDDEIAKMLEITRVYNGESSRWSA